MIQTYRIKILFSILLIFTIVSCNEKKTILLDDTFEIYSKNQIVYFKSNNEDFDTIRISKINRNRAGNMPTMDFEPYEFIKIEIQHLPKNVWHGITVIGDNGKININDEVLISIIQVKEKLIFQFMFHGSFGDTTFTNEVPRKFSIKMEPTSLNTKPQFVTQLTWDCDHGLVSYKVNDTIKYEIFTVK